MTGPRHVEPVEARIWGRAADSGTGEKVQVGNADGSRP